MINWNSFASSGSSDGTPAIAPNSPKGQNLPSLSCSGFASSTTILSTFAGKISGSACALSIACALFLCFGARLRIVWRFICVSWSWSTLRWIGTHRIIFACSAGRPRICFSRSSASSLCEMDCLSTFFESWTQPLFSSLTKDFHARGPSLSLFCKVKRGILSCRCYRPD